MSLRLPFAIFRKYRLRLGIVKLENFVFVCLCTRLSLYLYTMLDKFLTYLRSEKRYSEKTIEAYGRDILQFLSFLGLLKGEDAGLSQNKVRGQNAGKVNTRGAKSVSDSEKPVTKNAQWHLSSADLRDAVTHINDHNPGIDFFDPSAVSTDDIREWILYMSGRGFTATSINRKTSSLRSFFKYLRKTGAVQTDPFQGVGFRKIPARLPAFVPESKMEQILSDLEIQFESDSYKVCRDAMIVLLFYTTGLRVSELQGIRLGDFSDTYSQLRVRGKGDKERMVPIIKYTKQKIVEFLERINELNICKSPDLSLFLSDDGKPLSRSEVYEIVRSVLTEEGVQGKKSPHVLRHTFATHMLDGGADIREIQDILGHSSLASTQVYTHNSMAKLKEIYDKAHPRCREENEMDSGK